MGAPQYEQAGADIGGTGTTNTIPRWTGPSTLGDSLLIQASTSNAIGVGVTPLSTLAGYKSLEVGVVGSGLLNGPNDAWLTANAYYNSGWKYAAAASTPSNAINMASGAMIFYRASANTGGNALTWSESARIDSAGNFGIGTASPTNNGAGTQTLMVNGSTTGVYDLGVNGARQGSWFYSGGSVNIGSIANVPFALVQNATIRWLINTSGHLLANADNSYDIGASGATRPRIVYVGTGVVGGYIRAGAASAGVASTTTIGNGTSTTATAGAQTLPANPLGFIIAHVGTTEVRIPYYAV